MTVKELKDLLDKCDDTFEVLVYPHYHDLEPDQKIGVELGPTYVVVVALPWD